ncbi:pilus assembly protein [Pseudothauera nasutitermitis]|uniref:Pilus assembly protein n=1 Tax=Pseudothauera nasutitermitis TaxID=2565930 RepID=A0A4S4B1B9_9RHOO|nr:PilX N-terminal domain-containing pilus assembly protein [Pseudothauera nasutitermitis]THF65892.1 pilus assembly protein [Pseudothauera nasutitermitis]
MRLSSSAQRGIALIVALIILVVLTLLGLSSVRTVTMEERMTANTFDRALAFQAAEAALRLGEADARNDVYDDVNWQAVDVGALLLAAGNAGNATPPANLTYRVEWLDSEDDEHDGYFPCSGDIRQGNTEEANCKRYRITARSSDNDRASVELQTIYVTRP